MAVRLPILTFHGLDDHSSAISFRVELFGQAMAGLHDRGFGTMDLLEAVDLVQEGVPLPPQSLAITFDDGYESVYTEAFPVLERFGVRATVFLTVGGEASVEDTRWLPPLHGRRSHSPPQSKRPRRRVSRCGPGVIGLNKAARNG